MFSKKEKLILSHYKQSLENQLFDEFDLLGFFIFIRSFINKGTFPNIYEICDTVAHRKRNQGKAYTGIKNIIKNQYHIIGRGKKLQGANGITEKSWKHEWIRFGNDYSIKINDSIIQDISLCVVSLLQDVQIQDDQKKTFAYLKIFKFQNTLSTIITEGNDDSPSVIFFIPRTTTEVICDGIIDDAVYTVRENEKLRLLTEEGMFLV